MLLRPAVFARDAAFDDTLEDDVRMAPGLQKKLRLTAKASCITRNTAVPLYSPPKMENQLEKEMEHDMETGVIWVGVGLRAREGFKGRLAFRTSRMGASRNSWRTSGLVIAEALSGASKFMYIQIGRYTWTSHIPQVLAQMPIMLA